MEVRGFAMRAARWTLRLVLLAVLAVQVTRAVPESLRIGLREALRQPEVATVRVDRVKQVVVSTPCGDVPVQEWVVIAGSRCFGTSAADVGCRLQQGHVYRVRYHGNPTAEQCRLLAVLEEL